MNKKTRPASRFARLIFFLLALMMLLQGCIQLDGGNPQYSGTNEPTLPTGKGPYLYETMEYQYKTDASAFLSDITTGMSTEYLLLVNKQNPVNGLSDLGSADYMLEGAVELTAYAAKTGMTLEARTARALYAMLAEMAADGVTDVRIQSAYRTQTYQNTLFNNYLNQEKSGISADAKAYFGMEYIQAVYLAICKTSLSAEDARLVANYYSAFPGQSEHHTGLCVDFSTSTAGLTEAFAGTEAGQWLLANAYRFGFILRYPENKTDITGYCYEPWHYRFVGREAATEITLKGITLEEFLAE